MTVRVPETVTNNLSPNLILALLFITTAPLVALTAKAGCGSYTGLMQICFKGRCEVQTLIRHCSAASLGNHWISDGGYIFGYEYSRKQIESATNYGYMNHREEPSTLVVWLNDPKEGDEKLIYEGAPDKSSWSFDVCGNYRFMEPCSQKEWAKEKLSDH